MPELHIEKQKPRATYTREELLQALSIEPCHITGMHEPEHHTRYICESQKSAALDNLFALLGVKNALELPRKLHEASCGWCHSDSEGTRPEHRIEANEQWLKEGPKRNPNKPRLW